MLRAGLGVMGVLVLLSRANGAVVSLNLPQSLADTKAILAGGGAADILVLGDSLSYRTGSYLPYFRDSMQATYGNAGAGYQAFSLWTGAGFNGNVWTTCGRIGQDSLPHHALDGLWSATGVGPMAVSGQPNRAYFDAWSGSIELQYIKGPEAGSFRVDLPGGGAVTLNGRSDHEGIGTWQYDLPQGERRLWVEPQGDGLATILGANNVASSSGVRIHRAANGGWGVENFLQRDWTFDEQVRQLHPELVLVWLGANDAVHFTQSAYEAKMNLLVDRIRSDAPDAEIVLVGTYDLPSGGRMEGIVGAMEQVARDRELGFINMYEVGGNYESLLSRGFLDDGIHLSPAGGTYFGDVMHDAFVSDGASLVPEPGALGLAMLLASAMAMRRRAM